MNRAVYDSQLLEFAIPQISISDYFGQQCLDMLVNWYD